MKRILGVCAALMLCLGLVGSAAAQSEYAFTLGPTNGMSPADVAVGTLDVSNIPNGDGSYNVLSGTMTLLASSDGNASIGPYSIIPGNAAPGSTFTSPYGTFFVDNLLYPGNKAGSGVAGGNIGGNNPSYLTNEGLLFTGPGGLEANIWGNGGGDYAFYTATGPGNYGITDGGGLTFTLALVSVPEPASMAVWGLGLAGVFFVSRRRKA